MASASNFRTSLRRNNVIYTRATFSRTKASVKWSVTAATLSSVTSCMQIMAKFRLFQVKVMFKQHVNLMIWTWILRLQTASRNEYPCKNGVSQACWWWPNIECWLGSFVIFQGIWTRIAKKPYIFCAFSGGGVRTPGPLPLDPHMSVHNYVRNNEIKSTEYCRKTM